LNNNAAGMDVGLDYQGKMLQIKANMCIVTSTHTLSNANKIGTTMQREMSPISAYDPTRFLKSGEKLIGSLCFMVFAKNLRRLPATVHPKNVSMDLFTCFHPPKGPESHRN
jgi:hypothetical protein